MSIVLICIITIRKSWSLDVVYLSDSCNATVTASTAGAGLLEPDSSLYYKNNLDCQMVLATDSAEKRLLLQFVRFNLEEPIDGACVDYLTVYDGGNSTGGKLANRLCGRRRVANLVSSSNMVMLDFKTDDDGRTSGFGIFYTVFTDGPCDAVEHFNCSNGRCIASALECDSYDMCGDGSDEADCDVDSVIDDSGLSAAAIAGIAAGGVALILLTMGVVRMAINKYKSHKLIKELMKEMKASQLDDDYTGEEFWGDGDEDDD